MKQFLFNINTVITYAHPSDRMCFKLVMMFQSLYWYTITPKIRGNASNSRLLFSILLP